MPCFTRNALVLPLVIGSLLSALFIASSMIGMYFFGIFILVNYLTPTIEGT